jgi:hypothetical protein
VELHDMTWSGWLYNVHYTHCTHALYTLYSCSTH